LDFVYRVKYFKKHEVSEAGSDSFFS